MKKAVKRDRGPENTVLDSHLYTTIYFIENNQHSYEINIFYVLSYFVLHTELISTLYYIEISKKSKKSFLYLYILTILYIVSLSIVYLYIVSLNLYIVYLYIVSLYLNFEIKYQLMHVYIFNCSLSFIHYLNDNSFMFIFPSNNYR